MMKTSRSLIYLMLAFAGLIGCGGLLIFMIFLFRGSYHLVDLGMSDVQVLIFDAFLCLLFFVQHSLMARKLTRQLLKRFMPSPYYGAFYAVTSGIAVLILVVFWQETAYTLVSFQGLIRSLLRLQFLLAIVGVTWTIWALGFFVNFRLQPMIDQLREEQSVSKLVTDRGPYRWIRHPLYLSSILMIWSNPNLTLDRLFFNLLFTVWVILAILLEERGLVAAYGEAYRNYQRNVPMLIPWRIFPDLLVYRSSISKGAS